MSRQIYVGKDSPLCRFNVFKSLKIGDRVATSVEQARRFVMLTQSGSERLAERLLDDRRLQRFPDGCSTWVEANGGVSKACWLFNALDVYLDILLDQMRQRRSEFRRAFMDLVHSCGDQKPVFVVCTGNNELVLSCCVREAVVAKWDHRPGFNVYDEVLDKLYVSLSVTNPPRWGVKSLVRPHRRSLFPKCPFAKTALILSDSICRNVTDVEGGAVVRIPGGVFSDIIAASRSFRLGEFCYIIINCGVNVARRSELIRQIECEMITEFVEDIAHSPDPPTVIFSGAIPLPGARGVQTLNAMLADRLQNIPGVFFFNWSNHGGAPFRVNGEFVEEFLRMDRADGFHLGPTGFRTLWKEWCGVLPGLRGISYKLSTRRYADVRRPLKRGADGEFKFDDDDAEDLSDMILRVNMGSSDYYRIVYDDESD